MYRGYQESGYKECHRCGDVQPLTVEFFYKYELRGFANICLACSGKLKQERLPKPKVFIKAKRQRKERVQKPDLFELPDLETIDTTVVLKRRCKGCGKGYPLNSEFFYTVDKNKNFFTSKCKVCIDIQKQNEPPDEVKEGEGRANNKRRRARLARLLTDFTKKDWKYALEYFNGCCAVCGRQLNDMFGEFYPAQDHFIPITKGGHYIPENIIPLCHGKGGCNNSKADHEPQEWLEREYGKKKANEILAKIETFFLTVRQTRQDKAS